MALSTIGTNSIADDAVTSAKAVTGLATTVDLWRQNADTAINAATETVLTANWEQVDTDSFGGIGTAMSQSSGIFTFPETGIYLIIFNCAILCVS